MIPAQRGGPDVATTRDGYDVERDRRESVWTAASLIADGQTGKALFVLVRATRRCALLSTAEVDPVAAVEAYDACFAAQIQAWALRAVARRAET